jgi:hypothetical protein
VSGQQVIPRFHADFLSFTHIFAAVWPNLPLSDLEEVDLEHVLIWDFCDVGDYTRTLQAPKYYPDGQVPTDSKKLRRIQVEGKKGKRQLINLATWKYREARRAEQRRKQTLVEATAFKQ